MKKADFIYDWENLASDADREAAMFPFTTGNVYRFTLGGSLFRNRAEFIDGRLCRWTEAVADDGAAISVRQLTRRNNGLVLRGNTIRERLRSFVGLFSDDGHLALKVTKVAEHEFARPDGSSPVSRYLKFEVADAASNGKEARFLQ